MLNKSRLFVFLLWMALLLGSLAIVRNAMAVSLSSTGTGETLLFPYYTTRDGFDTYLTLLNTTKSSKAVRINFREGFGGKLVLGFNVYLAANDLWDAAVGATANGAAIFTADKSCTAPQITPGFGFFNYAYAYPSDVFSNTSLDRTKDGYFEVIEMGTIPSGSQLASNISPVNGVPKDCSWVNSQVFNTQSGGAQFVQGGALALNAPTGGMTGIVDLMNVSSGTNFAYSALALDRFLAGARHTAPGDDDLNLDSAAPVATISGHLTNWSRGADAVSAVLATRKLFGIFDLSPATLGATTLITFAPTRPYYAGGAPFSAAEPGCEPAGLSIFDSSGTATFNLTGQPTLCRVTSALGFGDSSGYSDTITGTPWSTLTPYMGVDRGSFSLDLGSTSPMTTATSLVNLGGLPVVGLVLQEHINGNVGGLLSNYGHALYAATDFNVLTFRTPVGSLENVDTLIKFAPADVGKTGSIFITASIPSDKLSILSGTSAHALNSKAASAKPHAAGSAAMVQIQLTSTGWQSVSNGQYIPFITGVYGALLAGQNILKNTDTTSLAGAKFCLGYGTSAAEMVEAGRMTTILTLQGATVSDSCIVTGTPTTISNPITSSAPICTLTATPISAGGASTLTASCSPAATTYVWSSNTGFASTAASGSVSPTMTTTYTVAGSNSAGSGPVASITVPVTAIPTASAQVVEFYNTSLDHYFITANASEAAAIDDGSAGPGWIRTGNSFKSGGSSQVCRFYGTALGPNSHFYTADAGECANLKTIYNSAAKSWKFESNDFLTTALAGNTCPAGTTPVYRAYNNGYARGVDSNHRITGSLAAIQEVAARGWSDEGVVMCAPN